MSDELGPDARAILDAGRSGDDPTEADRARVRAALMLSLAGGAAASAGAAGAGAGGAAGAGGVAGAAKTAFAAAALTKALAGFVIVGAVVSTIAIGLMPSGSTSKSGEAASAPLPSRAIAEAAAGFAPKAPASAESETAPLENPPAPTPNTADTSPATNAAHANEGSKGQSGGRAPGALSSKAPAPADAEGSASTLEAETRGLKEAHQAMRDGDPARAIELLDQQSTSFAGGVLRQERAAARVIALCQAGRPEATTEADRFLLENPGSMLGDRVRAACAPKKPRDGEPR